MSMLIVGCLVLTVLFRTNGVPKLFATAFSSTPPLAPAPIATAEPTTQLPQAEAPAIAPEIIEPETPAIEPEPQPRPAEPKTKTTKKPTEDIKYYQGKAYRYSKTIKLRVTAYAPDPRCCWPYPGTTTASGLSVKTNNGKLVAADTRLIPMHALVSVPGYHSSTPVPVLDRGGAIKGHRLDVLLPTYDLAKQWGSRTLEVKIYLPIKK
jgi:3D (Asp-Asp-Asp) domain-containing protein